MPVCGLVALFYWKGGSILSGYKVLKPLNHNVVLACYLNKYYIVIHKGIGFQAKAGDDFALPDKAHYYLLQDPSQLTVYEKLLLDTDESVLFVTEQAIQYAEKTLKRKFDESLHISLLDHLNFAIYRHQNGLQVGNYLGDGFVFLYESLYQLACEMLQMINDALDLALPKSEAGAIVLHLHTAINRGSLSKEALQSQIITDSIDYILRQIENPDASNIAKARLATHLKFALLRLEKGETLQGLDKGFLDQSYHAYYQIAQQLRLYLDRKYDIKLPESEVLYIAIHIRNLKNEKGGKENV